MKLTAFFYSQDKICDMIKNMDKSERNFMYGT